MIRIFKNRKLVVNLPELDIKNSEDIEKLYNAMILVLKINGEKFIFKEKPQSADCLYQWNLRQLGYELKSF